MFRYRKTAPLTAKPSVYKGVKVFFSKEGWLFLVLSVFGLFYFYGMHHKKIAYKELSCRLQALEKQKQMACAYNSELRLQIESQKDPKWIEMTLMRVLGVVPSGQIKVYFKK